MTILISLIFSWWIIFDTFRLGFVEGLDLDGKSLTDFSIFFEYLDFIQSALPSSSDDDNGGDCNESDDVHPWHLRSS